MIIFWCEGKTVQFCWLALRGIPGVGNVNPGVSEIPFSYWPRCSLSILGLFELKEAEGIDSIVMD